MTMRERDERVVKELSEVFELSISDVINNYDMISNTLAGKKIETKYSLNDAIGEMNKVLNILTNKEASK